MKIDRTTTVAILAGIVGAALLVMRVRSAELEARGGKLVAVLIALRELPLGSEVARDAFAVRMTPEHYIDDRHVRLSDAERLMGMRLTTSLGTGHALLWTDLTSEVDERRALSAIVPPGMRAVTLGSVERSVESELLTPGDHVDVLLTSAELPRALAGQRTGGVAGSHATVPLLQNVLVLAIGDEVVGANGFDAESDKSPRKGRRGGPVTLAVSASQAQLLTHAADFGRLSFVVRHPDDIEVTDRPSGATFAEVLSARSAAGAEGAHRIEKIN